MSQRRAPALILRGGLSLVWLGVSLLPQIKGIHLNSPGSFDARLTPIQKIRTPVSALINTRIRLSPGEDALLRILMERAGDLVLYSELASRLPNVAPDPRKATVRAMNTVEQVRHKLQHQGRPQILRGDGGVRFTLPASDTLEFEEASEAVPEAPATVFGGWMKDDAQGPIRKAYTAAGLDPLTFHELRHYADSRIMPTLLAGCA